LLYPGRRSSGNQHLLVDKAMKENDLSREKRPFEKKTLLISLLKVMFLVLIAITLFEYAKYSIFPGLTVFYSHIIGITFGVMIIGATAYRVQKTQEKLFIQKIAETERRMQSEASLLDVEEKFRKLFVDSMDGICQTTLDGKIVEANQAFCDILGCDADEIIGGSITQFYDNPEDRIKFRNVVEQNKGVKNYEIIQKRKDGQQIICSISSSCCYSENEELSGYLSIVRDITERKRMEEVLQENQVKLDLALRSAEMGVWHWDIIANKRYFDEQVCHLLGINPATFTGTTAEFIGAVHPDDRESIKAALARSVEQDVLYEPEYRAVWPDGSTHYIAARGRLFRDDKGRPLRINGIALDITERKRMEEDLKGSEAKYYDLYDNAPDMYYSLDLATGAIRECNESFILTTGYSKEELIGRPIFELYHLGSANDAKKSFQQFQVTGEVHDAERRVKCKDGRIIDVSLNVSAIRDKDGNITHSRSIWRDITKRKEQEEMIRALSITDQLTGLYNSRGFMTLAEQQLRVAERTKNGLFLLYADLDGLKQINDKLGHQFGDDVIVEAANVLKEVFRKIDIIARMGGDEFAVLAPEASSEYTDVIKKRLQDQLDFHNSRQGRVYNLSLSIGTVYYDPSTPSSLDELISHADSVMYEQKRRKTSFNISKGKQYVTTDPTASLRLSINHG
jgi:diguanylate cyclase (GGDEF)-like protein/PAS domain S-box-containing protein